MLYRLIFSVIFVFHIVSEDVNAVSFITRCKPEDMDCLKKSVFAAIPVFAAGLPEYKIEPLDPLHIDKVDGSSPTLKLITTNATVTGLKDCIVEKVERDLAHSKLNLQGECNVEYRSKYEMHGRVLVVPFEGKGDLRVYLRKIYLSIESEMGEKVDKQGVKHWNVKNYKYNYDLKGKADVQLSNLFDGNEVLSQAANELLATSGTEVVIEVGPPILKAIVEKIVKTVNKFYHSVPAEELEIR